jgi:nondiscriminating glutamyl-tRNA synthetase
MFDPTIEVRYRFKTKGDPAVTDIRVRIAPSPTGNLHVGTARTSLFNYLYAKHTGGKFILRIEDTDLERSEEKYIQDIFDGLKALGLQWDEGPDVGGPYGPYVQSERLELYAEYAQKLLAEGKAYPCYCTLEELEAEKQRAFTEGHQHVYSRRCLNPEEAARLKADPERKAALRFKIPDTSATVVLHDIIRGDVNFDAALIGDFVIMKSNGTPSYNFAVVVDDITMKITHVVRGEDHVSNTPKQMLLYDALGAPQPQFAHVGMILAPDRTKLSKRHGATAVADFVRQGYLPEAFVNFLALLGWSHPDGEEIGSLEKFSEAFTLERIAHSPAIFDQEKLNWVNGVYIRQLPLEDLLERAKPFLSQYDLSQYPDEKLCMMLGAVREPITTLSELPEAVSYFFGKTVQYDDQVKAEVLPSEETRTVLDAFEKDILPTLTFDAPEAISEQIKAFGNTLKPMKMKSIMWAIRGAVTGRVHGADLGKTLYILGKDVVAFRVREALQALSSQPAG